MNKLVCPKCGASNSCLRLLASVDSKIYLDENGITGPLDMIGMNIETLRENIVKDNLQIHCNICGKNYPAQFNDDGIVEIKKEEE